MAFKNLNLPTERTGSPLVSFRNEMNDFFDRFAREIFPDTDSGNFMPRVELKDNGTSYTLSAELPGLKEEDINVSLEDNALILQGERKNETKKEGKGFYRSEFSYGSFYRAIPLASDVNAETVEASYDNGVLKVTMDKVPEIENKSKKIPITKGQKESPVDTKSSTKH